MIGEIIFTIGVAAIVALIGVAIAVVSSRIERKDRPHRPSLGGEAGGRYPGFILVMHGAEFARLAVRRARRAPTTFAPNASASTASRAGEHSVRGAMMWSATSAGTDQPLRIRSWSPASLGRQLIRWLICRRGLPGVDIDL
jgi:hypothetical protein